jgi:putative thioredoxin
MAASDFIIDVSEADFEYEVLAYSQKVPVVVDFWAEWCVPCRTLGPLLERLAQEAAGDFRLAKVNVDQNSNLALRYGVHSIPAVKAFRNGEMVGEFVGLQPEPRVREFLRQIAPTESDLLLEKGVSLLASGDSPQAEETFRQVLELTPDSTAALLGLAKSLLLQGQGAEANAILADFSASREYKVAELLRPLSQVWTEMEFNEYTEQDDPLDPAYHNALRLAKRGNMEAAMDGLLDILREDKHYRNEEAREVMISLLELLGNDSPTARQYRRELSTVLF